MSEQQDKQSLNVTVYTDYICPFCYIGYLRLDKLRDRYNLYIDWRFLEIHPDNPPEGKPVTELGYPPEHWRMLMDNLARMAREEGVDLAERTFTTNSRRALKLARAVIEHQPECFERLNRELYEAFFLRRENIGDPDVLRMLAGACDVNDDTIHLAWADGHYEQVLTDNHYSAARLGINGTPAYVFGDQVYSGAIPEYMLRHAAEQTVGGR